MPQNWFTKNWGPTAYFISIIFFSGALYAGFVSLKSDVADIRTTLTGEIQSSQKRDVTFAEYKTKVDALDSKTTITDNKVAATEKQISDMAGDIKYLVRWVDDQKRQEARKP